MALSLSDIWIRAPPHSWAPLLPSSATHTLISFVAFITLLLKYLRLKNQPSHPLSHSHLNLLVLDYIFPTEIMISEAELIHKFQVFKIVGRDKCGRRVLQVVGKYFPARSVSVDSVTKYLEKNIFPELEGQPFSVLYLHAGVDKSENFPGISALRAIYDSIPVAVRENIEAVYFVHPGLQSRLFLATFGRFIFTGGVHGKIKYVSRVDYLWEHVRRKEVELPEFVYDHDENLEYRPMIDYGLEGDDHPRVYGMSTVDSPVIMYSTRCIS